MSRKETLFTNWIAGLSSFPGALVIHPRDMSPVEMIVNWYHSLSRDKRILVLTEGSYDSMNLEDTDSITINPYENNENLQDALTNEHYIIVDSIRKFRLNDIGQSFRNLHQRSRVIFLATLGMNEIDLQYLRFAIQGLAIFHLESGHSVVLKFLTDKSIMSQQQEIEYIRRKSEEEDTILNGPDNVTREAAILSLRSKEITNYIYPPDMQRMLDLSQTNRQSLPEDDIISQGGWVSEMEVTNLADNPKMFRLISNVIDLYNTNKARQIIYSRFIHRYGLRLISALLTLIDIEHIIITGADRDDVGKMAKFNNTNNAILLTSVTNFNINPRGVTDIHMLEGYEYTTLESLLNETYVKDLYEKPATLNIHSYLAMKGDGSNTVDGENYAKIVDKLSEDINLYKDIIQYAVPLTIKDG
jgi:hypothetical protein